MRRILLILLALIAVLLIVNTIVTGRETKAAKADVGEIVELPGPDLQVRERGGGVAATVLLHCYTCSIHWWLELEPLLASSSRVISIDLPGHGGSEKPRDGYSAEEQADSIAAALRKLDVSRALVVGQSLGGVIATALAERHPLLVRALVVMDSPPSDEYRDLPLTASVARAPVIGQLAKRTMPDSVVRDGLSDAFADGFDVPDQFVEDVRRMTFTSFKEVPEQVDDYLEDIPLDDRLAATHLPTVVAFGSEDTVVKPPAEAADEFRDIPGARVVMLDGVGHTPQVEAPLRVAGLITRLDSSTR